MQMITKAFYLFNYPTHHIYIVVLIEVIIMILFSIDIDECAGAANCMEHSHCVNAPGSYQCECNEGYMANGTACIGTYTRIYSE